MVRPLMTDTVFLAQKALPVDAGDIAVADDLLDTLKAHEDGCVGMAANMIGVRKRIIVAVEGTRSLLMYNPEVLEGTGAYETEEGCLSLPGTRPCTRFRTIRVRYLDERGHERTGSFSGYMAQIIQHEVDHTNGILI